MNLAVTDLTEMSAELERELVARAQDGDEQAFERLACHFRSQIIKICGKRISCEDACDLANAVLLKIWQNIEAFDPAKAKSAEPFKAWVTVIAHNALMSYLRRRRNPTEILMCDLTEDQQRRVANKYSCEATADQTIRVAEVLGGVAKESPVTAEIIRLKCVFGFSTTEVSRISGLNAAAVDQRMSRGRRLAKDLDGSGPRNQTRREKRENKKLAKDHRYEALKKEIVTS